VEDCLVIANSVPYGPGGGVYCNEGAAISRCVLASNEGGTGGGVYCREGGLVQNCTMNGNSAVTAGGAYLNYGGILQNCLVISNTASGSVGGVFCPSGGMVDNCTLSGNNAASMAGGLQFSYGAVIRNSIIYFNTASSESNTYGNGSISAFTNCCTTPAVGVRCLTNAPQFVNAAAGNFRLLPTSPCIDAGNNADMPTSSDLDGVPRPLDGNGDGVAVVDMGCFEFVSPTADTDGDGLADEAELRADTDPTRAESRLEILDIGASHGGVWLGWQGGTRAT
jgi:hypothetical protein